ncbi:MAG: tetratricopeptide repeat protein [Candidatus Hydrogenedentes bacterium]|nr:tetratricopeptide repeat protein [Candidatus Hydrogenedentota bacterium]
MPQTEEKRSVDTVRMWEIARYVEAHPDNYEQRWRLAKKLYAAWEYRLAVEHLQVLKKEWRRKLNVVRYLSATYYRLGRYDEAIQELREAIQFWPKELGLREQLARVLEVAGRREEAAGAWQGIQELQPEHPLANSAVRRLQLPAPKSPEEDLHIGESDSGINLSPGQICPSCGAQNSDDFDRCWQCHSVLYGGAAPLSSTPRPGRDIQQVLGMSFETARLVGSLTAVCLLTLCVYFSLRLLFAWHAAAQEPVVRTIVQLYNEQLGLSRVITGIVAVLFWPLMLSLGVRIAKPNRGISGSMLTLAGLILGAAAFLATALPLGALTFAPLVPVALSLPVLVWVAGLDFPRALVAWLSHLCFMVPLLLFAFCMAEYVQIDAIFNPLSDLPALRHHAAARQGDAEEGAFTFPGTVLPFEASGVTWESTGSPWLDRRAGQTRFAVATPVADPAFKFEIQDSAGTRVYDDVRSPQHTRDFLVKPGDVYDILVRGPAGSPVTVSATGFLRIEK